MFSVVTSHDVAVVVQSACQKWIDRALATKEANDSLLKHFGFCMMAEQAKPYRSKGGTSGEGLQWVQGHLKVLHEVMPSYMPHRDA